MITLSMNEHKGTIMNTKQWVDKILSNEGELIHWLKRQYIGEMGAAQRIRALAQFPDIPNRFKKVVEKIADDEDRHAEWVRDLLIARGIELPVLENMTERYWKPILEHAVDFDTMAAAGHHAEGMRLVRIRALAEDERVDSDIREVFRKILPDEEFHEKAFGAMSTQDAIQFMSDKHEKGLELLGLEI